MAANPVGLIIIGIIALIALVVLAIKKWDSFGAALTLFLGPIGMIVSVFNLDPVEFYLDVFKDMNDNICCSAAQILGKIGDSRAVEPLILGMRFISEYHRPALIEALGELGDPRAIEHIIPRIRGDTRSHLKALKKLTGQDFGRSRKKWKKWWKENKDKYLKKK